MAACAAALEPAAVRAARYKHELHRIVVKNVLCAILRAEANQKLNSPRCSFLFYPKFRFSMVTAYSLIWCCFVPPRKFLPGQR